MAAGTDKSAPISKISKTSPQPSPLFIPTFSSCIQPSSLQEESEDSETKTQILQKAEEITTSEQTTVLSTPSSINQIEAGAVTPTGGPPSYPPPALPPGVQPPAPPPGNIKPVTVSPQVPPCRPGKPPPIPHRSSLSRQLSTPPPPPRPK
ncbi:hypothetical protein HHI36_011323 [Cryptolaemus montrouzieri]|uniref:Uncharacterized protein n=1 Tax=Cryptolaemus montrouzieri TaxID=559131 RepID=A0ABD2MLF2_9CUCU